MGSTQESLGFAAMPPPPSSLYFFFSEKLLLGSLLTLSGSGSFHHMAIVCLLLKKKDCLFKQDASACTCLWARPSRRQAVNSLPCVGRVHAPGDLPSESETHSFSEPFGLYQRSQQPHWVRHFFLPSRPRIYYIYISVMLVDAVQCLVLCGHGATRDEARRSSSGTKPVGTVPLPVKPVQSGFGLSRYQTSPNSKFKFKFKKMKNSQKISKNTSRCDESNGVEFSQKFVHLV